MRVALHVSGALGNQRAKGGHRRLHAQAEEAQERLEQDHRRDGQRRVDDHDADQVRYQVAQDHRTAADARDPRRLDELAVLQRERLAAHDARDVEP